MKFYSPAIISSKQSLVFGHGVNIVWNDVIARHMQSKGQEIEYFFPSWNHQGKRVNHLDKGELEQQVERLEKTMGEELACFGIEQYTPYRDTDKSSQQNAQKHFMQLQKEGFIVEQNGEYFANLLKIYSQTQIIQNLESVRYHPTHLRKRMLDLTKTLTGFYPISKKRRHATPIHNSFESINPIFDLAVSPALFSEESADYCIDGCKTLLRGTFFPFVIWSALFDKPFARNLCAHGLLHLAGGLENMKIEDIKESVGNPFIDSDVLRYCALLSTNSLDDIEINPDTLTKGKKMIYRACNLAKHFVKHYGPQQNQQGNEEIEKMIETMQIIGAVENFRNGIYELSKKIERGGKINDEDIKKYLKMTKSIGPVFPLTSRRIGNIINGQS
jgi:hypothetical protein